MASETCRNHNPEINQPAHVLKIEKQRIKTHNHFTYMNLFESGGRRNEETKERTYISLERF